MSTAAMGAPHPPHRAVSIVPSGTLAQRWHSVHRASSGCTVRDLNRLSSLTS